MRFDTINGVKKERDSCLLEMRFNVDGSRCIYLSLEDAQLLIVNFFLHITFFSSSHSRCVFISFQFTLLSKEY